MTAQPIYRNRPGGYGPDLYAVRGALCQDGVRRTAYITAEADTYFGRPARVSVKGKTVSGFIHSFEADSGERDYEFVAYSYRKNGYLIYGDEP